MLYETLLFLTTLPIISLGLKITRFEVPSLVVPGDSVILTCFYDLGKEKLYSVKWYKDKVEFFRFFPSLSPQYMSFPAPGLDVDLSKSSPNTVYLRNLTLKSEGQYTCQVSADEPYFGCVQVHRNVIVYIPPESSPKIYGEVSEFGDNLTLLCSSAKSKPAANLSWYVNDVLIDSGTLRDSQEVVRHSDQLESSSSVINIPFSSRHLPSGEIRLICAASIADVVTSVSQELVINRPSPDRVLELKNVGSKLFNASEFAYYPYDGDCFMV
nr:endothelial cell-selective adhesion molecule [Parasteatoda tepidariorum]